MAFVEIEPRADALFGIIERKYKGNSQKLTELKRAYYGLILELQNAHPSIWCVPSDDSDDAKIFVLYDPPLKAFFKQVNDQRIGIVRFAEISP